MHTVQFCWGLKPQNGAGPFLNCQFVSASSKLWSVFAGQEITNGSVSMLIIINAKFSLRGFLQPLGTGTIFGAGVTLEVNGLHGN